MSYDVSVSLKALRSFFRQGLEEICESCKCKLAIVIKFVLGQASSLLILRIGDMRHLSFNLICMCWNGIYKN